MTDLTFTVNGKDFSALVHRDGIKTFLEPVYSSEITTLNKIRRRMLVRYRGVVHIKLNDLEQGESEELCAELMKWPLVIGYYSFQRRRVVTETMSLDPYAVVQLFRNEDERWLSGTTLKFEQE